MLPALRDAFSGLEPWTSQSKEIEPGSRDGPGFEPLCSYSAGGGRAVVHDSHLPQPRHLSLEVVARVLVKLQQQRRGAARLERLVEGEPERQPGKAAARRERVQVPLDEQIVDAAEQTCSNGASNFGP